MKKKCIVLLSGGLDSTTVLALAKSKGYECYCISFEYGQKQIYELTAAKKIANKLGAKEHIIFKVDINQFGGSALTDENINVPDYSGSSEIPVTYVPARNITFLSIALGYAEVKQAKEIFIGVSSVDYSGYPDCRLEFIKSFEKTANLATKIGVEEGEIKINTPLINLSKAETIELGKKLGVDYKDTVSCYNLSKDGKACGMCDSCTLRKKGFINSNIDDVTQYL